MTNPLAVEMNEIKDPRLSREIVAKIEYDLMWVKI
jgi:hypothetical protein